MLLLLGNGPPNVLLIGVQLYVSESIVIAIEIQSTWGKNLLLKTHGRKYRATNENNKLIKLLLRSDGHNEVKLVCILLKGPKW